MKNQISNHGFSKAEVMVVLCALLVFLAILIKSLSDNKDTNNYSMLKKQAENFIYKVSIYKDMYTRDDNVYYLDYLIDNDYAIDLSNPFDATDSCDRYESFVKIEGSKKSVSLKCGHFLIEGVSDGEYTIYQLSDWTEEAANGEFSILYNYRKNGEEVGDHYMLENEFIDFYNEKEDSHIVSLAEVSGDDIQLVTKSMYREKIEVKKIG